MSILTLWGPRPSPSLGINPSVRIQTNRALVTCSRPVDDGSCQFVSGPKDVRSTNACQMKTIQDDLRVDVWQVSHRFHLFLFEVTVIKKWCRDLVQLLNRFLCHFAISFHAFLRMTFHVIKPSDRFRVGFLPTMQLFNCSSGDSWLEHLSFFINNTFVRFAITMSASQVHMVKKWCRFHQINEFHSFLPHAVEVLLHSSHLFRPSGSKDRRQKLENLGWWKSRPTETRATFDWLNEKNHLN